MIVGNLITPLAVPHEPGNIIRVRELSGLEMDDAMDSKSTKVMRKLGSLGGETLAAIRAGQPTVSETAADVRDSYDWEFLVVHAIEGWEGSNYDGIECNEDTKKKLDKPTLEWIVDEIIRMNTVSQLDSRTSVRYSIEGM